MASAAHRYILLQEIRMNKYFVGIIIFIAIAVSVSIVANAANPYTTAESAVVIDADTGQVLYGKNMHLRLYPASITKIMTALLALENGSMSDNIVMSHDAVFSVGRYTSHIALDVEEVLSLEQALYAIAIVSANDASNGIAELIGGSMKNFALMMSERAVSAGALNTNFTNAHGLPDENHYTTAYDMALIMLEAIKTPEFNRIFSTVYYEMPPTNINSESRHFWRTGSLITDTFRYEGVISEKSGWTSAAGSTFAVAAQRDGRTLIAVVMNSENVITRRHDIVALFDYGFNEFKPIRIRASEISKDDYIIDGVNVSLQAVDDFYALIDNSLSENDIEIRYVHYHDENNRLRVIAEFWLKPQVYSTMYRMLGSMELLPDKEDVLTETVEAVADTDSYETSEDELSGESGSSAIITILGVSGILFTSFSILYTRKILIVRRRRKRRRMMRRYR